MSAACRGRELILGIEAATPVCSVALASAAGEVRAQRIREQAAPASAYLLGDIEALLTEAGAGRSDLAAVAVTLGPGAFTGLRVGLALAKTLAHALGIPLYGFSTLAMLARRWPKPGPVAALLDARRSEVYAGLYPSQTGPSAGAPCPLMQDCVAPIATVLENMEVVLPGGPVGVLGNGALKYREMIERRWGARAVWGADELMFPVAAEAARAGAEAWRGGLVPLDPFRAEPVYLRASDAAVRHPEGIQRARAPGNL